MTWTDLWVAYCVVGVAFGVVFICFNMNAFMNHYDPDSNGVDETMAFAVGAMIYAALWPVGAWILWRSWKLESARKHVEWVETWKRNLKA